jgi:aspartyl protease family protein
MLRFLGIYPVAILLATAFAAVMVKNKIPARTKPTEMSAQAYAVTPAKNFGPIMQDIAGDASGQYLTQAQLEGRELQMIIDTGATLVSLTNEDASALGIRPSPSEFTIRLQTANGVSTAARVWLPHVRVGAVEVHDVEALVMAPGASRISLLGMSFLSRLNRFGVAGNHLRLEQ